MWTIWDSLKRYPSVSIEQIGTPYDKVDSHDGEEEYDYIIAGGQSVPFEVPLTFRGHRRMRSRQSIECESGGEDSCHRAWDP